MSQGTGAVILTAAITKGRDNAWQGAIDGLRINNEVFDFEEPGVLAVNPQINQAWRVAQGLTPRWLVSQRVLPRIKDSVREDHA